MNKNERSLFKRIFPRLALKFPQLALKSDVDNIYAQISDLLEIRDIIGPHVQLGQLREWALSPDALLIILRALQTRSAPQLVEFCAGKSTVAIGAALRAAGAGSLVSFEHDPHFANEIREQIEQIGLQHLVDIRLVAMKRYGPRLGLPEFQSYDLSSADVDFDIALIDGPPVGQYGAASRSVPLDWCIDRLKSSCEIYLDDADRHAERSVIKGSGPVWSGLHVEALCTEKGLLKISRS